jgi:hypothetical protein
MSIFFSLQVLPRITAKHPALTQWEMIAER